MGNHPFFCPNIFTIYHIFVFVFFFDDYLRSLPPFLQRVGWDCCPTLHIAWSKWSGVTAPYSSAWSETTVMCSILFFLFKAHTCIVSYLSFYSQGPSYSYLHDTTCFWNRMTVFSTLDSSSLHPFMHLQTVMH